MEKPTYSDSQVRKRSRRKQPGRACVSLGAARANRLWCWRSTGGGRVTGESTQDVERVGHWTQDIHQGDALDLLDDLPEESIHAVVTDPPYGLAFMGRDWDDFQPLEYQEWCEEWASKALRVLKPGGHLLAFSGNRTHHRLFAGVEDAGFEIRDTLTYHYGSGFPKSTDVSKVIDKRADAERTEGKRVWRGGQRDGGDYGNQDRVGEGTSEKVLYDKPATAEAEEWDGWKTGLKPATEFVVMARKPHDGATVDCVLEHGTGALNIDGCRIEHEGESLGGGDTSADSIGQKRNEGWERPWMDDDEKREEHAEKVRENVERAEELGRYPANVVFGECAAVLLDTEVGEAPTGDKVTQGESDTFSGIDENGTGPSYTDSGGPSRYFYTSKASRAERTLNGRIENGHPTVKPTDLMEWLVRMVTREGQIVLDPFAGTGTTCLAAKNLGRRFVGVEKQEEYVSVAQARVGVDVDDPGVLTGDDETSLAAFSDGGGGDE